MQPEEADPTWSLVWITRQTWVGYWGHIDTIWMANISRVIYIFQTYWILELSTNNVGRYTETEMSSFLWNFHYWVALTVAPKWENLVKMTKISISVYLCNWHRHTLVKVFQWEMRDIVFLFCFIVFVVCSFNSLWPIDAIWRQRSRSTLVQVMDWCLTAQSHYLNQCWLIIIVSNDAHLRAISLEMSQPSVTKISVKIIFLRFYWNLPGANELNDSILWHKPESSNPLTYHSPRIHFSHCYFMKTKFKLIYFMSSKGIPVHSLLNWCHRNFVQWLCEGVTSFQMQFINVKLKVASSVHPYQECLTTLFEVSSQ